MAGLFPDMEPERLSRRVKFLQSRAEAHLNAPSEDMLHIACAGTLLRDAACVALLNGETTEARNHLKKAGYLFLRLGLAAGSTFIALAETKSAKEELSRYQKVIEGVSRQWDREEARKHEAFAHPMAEESRSSPRQMFSLLQAKWLIDETAQLPLLVDDSEMQQALERNGGYPIGTTGLSIETYSTMVKLMSEKKSSDLNSLRVKGEYTKLDSAMPEFVAQGFATVAVIRAENIRAAKKDSYHWRLLLRPAELLDLDTVVMSSIALSSGIEKGAIEKIFSGNALIYAPVEAAARLRKDQNL